MRHWRGERTQRAMATALDVHPSTIAHWESGRNACDTSVAFAMAELATPGTLERLGSWVSSDWTERVDIATGDGVALLMNDLLRKRDPSAVAGAIGVDRSTFGRWLRAVGEPKLVPFLAFLDAVSLRETVVHLLAPDGPLVDAPTRGLSHRAREIGLTLKLEAYRGLPRHDAAWVSKHASQTPEEVAASLAELEAMGAIAWSGTHWVVRHTPSFSFRHRPTDKHRVRQFLHGGKLDRHQVILAIFSEQDRERIGKVLFDAGAEIKRIIKQSGHDGDRVGYVSLAMLMLGDQPDPVE
ncbi:MAG: helix-turn-helix transcriptional regulator [Myxococcota bacterium]